MQKKFYLESAERRFEPVDQSQSRARTGDIRRTGYDRFEPVRRPITNEHGADKRRAISLFTHRQRTEEERRQEEEERE